MSTGASNVRRSKASERKISQYLLTLTGKKFRRRRVEGRNEHTIAVESTGDVIPIDGKFKFNIECKIERGFSFDAILKSDKSLFSGWWTQCLEDCILAEKINGQKTHPMLIFRPANNQEWIAITECVLGDLVHLIDGQKRPKSITIDLCGEDLVTKCKPIIQMLPKDEHNKPIWLNMPNPVLFRTKEFEQSYRISENAFYQR